MFITMFNLDRPVAEKPRNKRTAKGLILSGAQGKNARRSSGSRVRRNYDARKDDGCYCFDIKRSQQLDAKRAINDQLEIGEELFDNMFTVYGFPTYTTQSENFIPKMGKLPKGSVSRHDVIDTETGLPLIVINDTDMSQFCDQFDEEQLLSVGTLADPDSEEPWL